MNYRFAQDVKGADIKVHEDAILNGKNVQCNFEFARLASDGILRHLIVLHDLAQKSMHDSEAASYYRTLCDDVKDSLETRSKTKVKILIIINFT